LTRRALLHAKPRTTDDHVLPFASGTIRPEVRFASLQDSSTIQSYLISPGDSVSCAPFKTCFRCPRVLFGWSKQPPIPGVPTSSHIYTGELVRARTSYEAYLVRSRYLLLFVLLGGKSATKHGVPYHAYRVRARSIAIPAQVDAQPATNRTRPPTVDRWITRDRRRSRKLQSPQTHESIPVTCFRSKQLNTNWVGQRATTPQYPVEIQKTRFV
jgi:hypothetical protein